MRSFALLWLILSLLSCTKEVDLPYPSAGMQVALNGILHPDSLIQVTLTRNLPLIDSSDFLAISDASVVLYENGQRIGTLNWQGNVYRLDYRPQTGKEYTVEADVPNYGTVTASDIVPNQPTAKLCFHEDTARVYQFSNANIAVSVDTSSEGSVYWFDMVYTYYDGRLCKVVEDSLVCDNGTPAFLRKRIGYYQSFSTLPDPFNSFVDNTGGGVRQYDGYIRLSSETVNNQKFTLDITSPLRYEYITSYQTIHEGLSYKLNVINASATYDRYLKSSLVYYLNNEFFERPDPFAEPTKIYSNVENGTGIFAAYNSATLEIGDFPCP